MILIIPRVVAARVQSKDNFLYQGEDVAAPRLYALAPMAYLEFY